MAGRRGGFTLVELMATVAVLALVLGLALPSLRTLAEAQAALARFHGLTVALAQARMAAIQRGRPVSVCPSADGSRCRLDLVWDEGWLVYADPQRLPQPARPEDILWVERRDPGAIAIRGTAGRHRVRYQPTGLSGGNNTSLRLCSRDGRLLGSVVVNIAGRTRSERAPADPAPPCPYAP